MNLVFFLPLLFLSCASRAEKLENKNLQNEVNQILQQKSLKDIRSQIKETIGRLDSKVSQIKPGESDRAWAEYMSLGTHKDFLELLEFDVKNGKVTNCEKLRLKVIQGFSPRNDFPQEKDAPLAAVNALKVLAHACQRPDLALFPKGP